MLTCDKPLTQIARTMRFLTSNLGICVDAGIEMYASNELAEVLDTPMQSAMIESAYVDLSFVRFG